jgi:hypothetical protein
MTDLTDLTMKDAIKIAEAFGRDWGKEMFSEGVDREAEAGAGVSHTRISIDWENNAETWWDAAREAASTAPDVIRPLLGGRNVSDVSVSASDLPTVLAWCSSLPGWEDGPAHARRPLVWNEA